jgi:hypothetical protein
LTSRPIAIHPPLFALHPVLSLHASNVSLVPIGDLWTPCLVVFACSLVVWGIAALACRSVLRGARLASAAAFSFFMFGTASEIVVRTTTPSAAGPDVSLIYVVWSLIALAALALSGWKWKDDRRLNTLFNIAGSLMCALAVFSIASSHYSIRAELRNARERLAPKGKAAGGSSPDVFYIVLDGYGRDDVLRSMYGPGPSALADQLEERGFYVAREARSNYVQTQLSLASSLNFEFVQSLVQPMGNSGEERLALDTLIDESQASKTLKGLGYKTFAVTTGFPALTFSRADVSIKNDVGRTLFVDALMQKTPIRSSVSAFRSQFEDRRTQLLGGFNEIERLAKRGSAPRFVVVHILAPHPPFVFGPNGEPRHPKGNYVLSDGSHYVGQVGTAAEYRSGYRDQAAYVGKLLLRAVDALIAEPGPAPVILVQGDHGPKSKLDQESATYTDMDEAFPILSAYYVPQAVRERLYPKISPVNSFRVVFDALFGMELPLLEDASYYSTWSEPLVFVNVTGHISERN